MIELNSTKLNQLESLWLGMLDYKQALNLQMETSNLVRDLKKTGIILGLHHPSIITLGKRADPAVDLMTNCQLPTVTVDRGGQATLHSPGQLVIYPILNLETLDLDVKDYVCLLQKATMALLKDFGVQSFTTDQPGVFTEKGKIAFIGVRVERGVARHGISINISNDLSLFSNIRSCGIMDPQFDILSNYTQNLDLKLIFNQWFLKFKDQFRDRSGLNSCRL